MATLASTTPVFAGPDDEVPVDTTTPDTAVPDTSTPDTTVPDTAAPDTTVPAPDTTVPAPDTTVPAPDSTVPVPDTTVSAPDTTVQAPVDVPAATPDATADRVEAQATDVAPAIARPLGDDAETLRAALADDDELRVIVTTKTPVAVEADLTATAVDAQRAAIDTDLAALTSRLADTGSVVLDEYEVVPGAVVQLDRAGLDTLLADPAVASITIDEMNFLDLGQTTAIIDSDRLNDAGVRGGNRTGGPRLEVAILDSGVALGHPAFRRKIVSQACYSAGGDCPNGRTSQVGGKAGRACGWSSQCTHGSHVAGIAAGASYSGGHKGVAPKAGIISIQIGSRSNNCGGAPTPCWTAFTSDIDRALRRVATLRKNGRSVVSVNLSVGGGGYSDQDACTNRFPATQLLAADLKARGVATIAATGNNGFGNKISFPACVHAVYSVGATRNNDVPAGFSNSSPGLDWWAPGVEVRAPVPGGSGVKSGTSMAAPHVAGAFTLLRQCRENRKVKNVVADLHATGKKVTHNGVTRRRINVISAASRNVGNDHFANSRVKQGRWHDVLGTNSCATRQKNEPGTGKPNNSVWFTWRPTRSGTGHFTTNSYGKNKTSFDTQLTVFRWGSNVGNTIIMRYNDDSGEGNHSKIVMPVRRGVKYRVRVDGKNAQNGSFNLHMHVD